MTVRVALYARFSSDLQNKSSIDDQLHLCRARAERNGWTIVATFSDAAISGSTILRPGYQAMLASIRAGEVDVVLAESQDRFSRDLEHVAALYKLAQFKGVRLVTLAENELNTLTVGLKGTMGALYLTDLADKTRRGLMGRIRKGRATGRVVYGYRMVRRVGSDGEPERGLREPDPVEAAIVQRIYRDYAAGKSPLAIAKALNAEGTPSPNGGLWRDATIRGRPFRGDGMLRAEIYVGRLVWNRRRSDKNPETGQVHSRPNSEAARAVGDAPDLRLIDDALWDAVQARLAAAVAPTTSSGRPAFWEARRPQHLLSGKVFCGCCGRTFIPIGKDYMACRAVKLGACSNNRRVRRSKLERIVLDALATRLMEPALAEAFITALIQEWSRLAGDVGATETATRAELAQVERRIANLVEALAEGVVRGAGVSSKMADLEERRQTLEAMLATAPREPPRLHRNLATVYRETVCELRSAIERDDGTEALEAARKLIDRVIISPPPDGGGSPRAELVGSLPAMLAPAGVPISTTESADGSEKTRRIIQGLQCSDKEGGGGQSPSPVAPCPTVHPSRPDPLRSHPPLPCCQ
jgi:DNA invertase Pin-like site-specific DNA recombinase